MPRSCDPAFWPVVQRAKKVLGTYADMEELIRLGAYRPGASAEVDEAIALNPALEAFLAQAKEESTPLDAGYRRLAEIVGPEGLEAEGVTLAARRPGDSDSASARRG